MHPFHDHTLILIDIQAPNQLEILTCIKETFDYMPGWKVMSSVHQSSTDSRFFCFNLTEHTFEWWRTNTTFSDTMDEDEVIIKDLADISHLLEFVYENTEKLREKEDLAAAFSALFETPSWKEPPPKKRKKSTDNIEQDIAAHMAKKLAELALNKSKPAFNPMMFLEPMPHPTAQVYYKDFAAGGKSIPYEASKKVKLKSSWGTDAEMTAWQAKSAKMHEEMAEEISNEIDKEIIAKLMSQYMDYTKQFTEQKLESAYDKAAKQSKAWSKGWGYTPHNINGIMMSPYNMQDSISSGIMDY